LVKKEDENDKMLLKSTKIKNIDKYQVNYNRKIIAFESVERLIVYEDVFCSNDAINVVMKYSSQSIYVDLSCLVSDLVLGKAYLTEKVAFIF
jgi:hypothetical protein